MSIKISLRIRIISTVILLSSTINVFGDRTIHISELLPGDIIFWAKINSNDRAGHIAVITDTNNLYAKDIKITHATDNPKYNSFVKTHILPSSKLLPGGKEYKVIRLKSPKLAKSFTKLLNSWVGKISFDKNMELLMNKWDDSLIKYSTETKIKIHNLIYKHIPNKLTFSTPQKGMCSEIIIKALQESFHELYNVIPHGLHLDPGLCPPSTMMLSLIKDNENFDLLGTLFIEDYKKIEQKNATAQ